MKKQKIIIIDYGIGNVRSISNCLKKIGYKSELTSDHNKILSADKLILPGVGAFKKGMDNLILRGLDETIVEYVNKGKPLLGICLGMQMIMTESQEFGVTKGLNLIQGKVIKLKSSNKNLILPHVSWNELLEPEMNTWKDTILENHNSYDSTYFVHSFVACPENKNNILSYSNYSGISFCSSIYNNMVFGVQFHPEKSGEAGMKILDNFINIK